MRLDRFLAECRPTLPFSLIQKLIRTKKVEVFLRPACEESRRWIKVRDPSLQLESGIQVGVWSRAFAETANSIQEKDIKNISEADAAMLKNSVLYSDHRCLILNKPQGLAVQGGTKTEKHLDSWLHVLQDGYEQEPRLVHRLDRDTSGCLVLARSRESAAAISEAFKRGWIGKEYLALVAPCPSLARGIIRGSLAKRRGGPGQPERVVAMADGAEGREAVTEYEVLGRRTVDDCGFALLRLRPRSGRTHQLRVHCATGLGAAIVGDGKYGQRGAAHQLLSGLLGAAPSLCLHAATVRLPARLSSAGTPITCAAPLPSHFRRALAALNLPIPPEA